MNAEMDASAPRRALVVGAGIGGLCAAIALRRAGLEPVVYERAPALRPVGAGLTLWPNAIGALRELGLAEAVVAAGAVLAQGALLTARGRSLSRTDGQRLARTVGEPMVAIHRAALHGILMSALPPDAVRLGRCLLSFRQGDQEVEARFEGGEATTGALLVGADGLHSAVRAQLFPQLALRYSGYTAFRGVVDTREESALGLTSESWGAGARFGIVRIDRESVYWFATANGPAGHALPAAERRRALRSRFAGWHAPIPALIDLTPEERILQNDIWDLAPAAEWGRGRVTLLGDAIHPTTPNLGQGAGMAIESAVVMGRCVSATPELPAALRRYENERRPRTRWITETSWRMGRLGQMEGRLGRALRDTALRLTPASVTERALLRASRFPRG